VKMSDNLPLVPEDWEDFNMSVKRCPPKSFVVRIPSEEAEPEAEVAKEASA